MRASSTASGEFFRVVAKARREQHHEPRHGDLAENGDGDEENREPSQSLTGEGTRGFGPVGVQASREERNEGRIEGALGEQAAKHIGHAVRHEEGVGHERGAEHGGDQHVAHEAEHAAQDGHRADRCETAIELHALRQE